MSDRTDQPLPTASLPAPLPTATAPQGALRCGPADAVLTAALEAVASLDGDDLEAVLRTAEAQRPGVRQALGAAFEGEAQRFAELSRRAFAAADRLAAHLASAERGRS